MNYKIVTTTEQLLWDIYQEQQKTNKLLKELIGRLELQTQPKATVETAQVAELKRGRRSKEELPK